MLMDLDKKLKIQVDKKIYKKNNKKKFNVYNAKIMSLGWVFVLDIFLFVILGYFARKYIVDSSFIFIFMMIVGIIFAFFNLKNTIKRMC